MARQAGGRDVLLEKPVDVDYARSKALVDAVEGMDRVFGIVFQHRFREASIALREALRAGALGDLLAVSASIRWWKTSRWAG